MDLTDQISRAQDRPSTSRHSIETDTSTYQGDWGSA